MNYQAISFLAEPKPFSRYYLLGGLLVLLGLVMAERAKTLSKKSAKAKASPATRT
jgi:hypothetical protein